MLSEEEKKAIERIDYIQDFIIENGQYNADISDMQYFSKILNLIKKQQAEIKKKDKIIDKMGQELFIEIEPHFDTLEQCIEFYTNKVEEENK